MNFSEVLGDVSDATPQAGQGLDVGEPSPIRLEGAPLFALHPPGSIVMKDGKLMLMK